MKLFSSERHWIILKVIYAAVYLYLPSFRGKVETIDASQVILASSRLMLDGLTYARRISNGFEF